MRIWSRTFLRHLLIATFCLVPATLFAQEPPSASPARDPSTPPSEVAEPRSRSEWWLMQKRAKSETFKPPIAGRFERFLIGMERKTTDRSSPPGLSRGPFFISAGTLTSGSGLGLEPGIFKSSTGKFPLFVKASAGFSYRGYEAYSLQFGRFRRGSNRVTVRSFDSQTLSEFNTRGIRTTGLSLFADVAYLHFPQQDFFGIGPDSLRERRTDFLLRGMTYEGVLEYQPVTWLGVGLRTGVLDLVAGPGSDDRFSNTVDVFSEAQAPGISVDPSFYRTTANMVVDFRDVPGNPHSGTMLGLMFSRFDDRNGGQFSFDRYTFDLRNYVPLGSPRRVLAMRVFTHADSVDPGASVPFYLLGSLGGSSSLRGYESYRFRDNRLLFLSAEYRWEAIPAIELALFYDAGKVFSRRADLNFRHLQKSFGIGFRLKTTESVLVRLDIGHSREGNRINLSLQQFF